MIREDKGFTLVELSIVIVIVGLIVAGVVGGQELVKQAQLRAIVSEQAAIKTAFKAFRLEYNALPGDFINARAYWTGCGADDGECNGDGNNQVNLGLGGTDPAPDDHLSNEAYRAWEHLSLSGIYPGEYTGQALDNATDNGADIGSNIPASRYPGAGITYHTNTAVREHHIIFGTTADDGTGYANYPIFSVKDTASLDEKLDDAVPNTGIMIAINDPAGCVADPNGADSCCVDNANAYNFDIDLTTTPIACAIYVID